MTRARLAASFVLLSLAACGQSQSGRAPEHGQGTGAQAGMGAGGGAGAPSAGTGAGALGGSGELTLEPPCFDEAAVVTCHELFPQEREVSAITLAESAEFAPGAHFAKLGGWAALVEFSDDRPPRLVLTELDSTVSSFDIDTSDASGALDIVGVWGDPSGVASASLSARAVALGCNDAGCRLLAAEQGDDTLHVLPAYDLDAAQRVDGIAGSSERLCVYGQGLHCLDEGGWDEVIPAPDSGQLTAVSLSYPALAATADGRLLVEAESGSWALSSTVGAPARRVDSYGRTLSVLTEDGVWVIVSTDPPATATCEQTPSLLLATPGSSVFGIPWLVVDERGDVFRQRQTSSGPGQPDPNLSWCRVSNGPEAVRDVSRVPCADGTNLLVITDDGLYSLFGRIACPLT